MARGSHDAAFGGIVALRTADLEAWTRFADRGRIRSRADDVTTEEACSVFRACSITSRQFLERCARRAECPYAWSSEHDKVSASVPHRCSYVYQASRAPPRVVAPREPLPISDPSKKRARPSGVQEQYALDVAERVMAKQRGVAERVLRQLEPEDSNSRAAIGRFLRALRAIDDDDDDDSDDDDEHLAAALEDARDEAAALHRLSLRQVDEACLLRLVQVHIWTLLLRGEARDAVLEPLAAAVTDSFAPDAGRACRRCGEACPCGGCGGCGGCRSRAPHGRVPGAWHLHPHALGAPAYADFRAALLDAFPHLLTAEIVDAEALRCAVWERRRREAAREAEKWGALKAACTPPNLVSALLRTARAYLHKAARRFPAPAAVREGTAASRVRVLDLSGKEVGSDGQPAGLHERLQEEAARAAARGAAEAAALYEEHVGGAARRALGAGRGRPAPADVEWEELLIVRTLAEGDAAAAAAAEARAAEAGRRADRLQRAAAKAERAAAVAEREAGQAERAFARASVAAVAAEAEAEAAVRQAQAAAEKQPKAAADAAAAAASAACARAAEQLDRLLERQERLEQRRAGAPEGRAAAQRARAVADEALAEAAAASRAAGRASWPPLYARFRRLAAESCGQPAECVDLAVGDGRGRAADEWLLDPNAFDEVEGYESFRSASAIAVWRMLDVGDLNPASARSSSDLDAFVDETVHRTVLELARRNAGRWRRANARARFLAFLARHRKAASRAKAPILDPCACQPDCAMAPLFASRWVRPHRFGPPLGRSALSAAQAASVRREYLRWAQADVGWPDGLPPSAPLPVDLAAPVDPEDDPPADDLEPWPIRFFQARAAQTEAAPQTKISTRVTTQTDPPVPNNRVSRLVQATLAPLPTATRSTATDPLVWTAGTQTEDVVQPSVDSSATQTDRQGINWKQAARQTQVSVPQASGGTQTDARRAFTQSTETDQTTADRGTYASTERPRTLAKSSDTRNVQSGGVQTDGPATHTRGLQHSRPQRCDKAVQSDPAPLRGRRVSTHTEWWLPAAAVQTSPPVPPVDAGVQTIALPRPRRARPAPPAPVRLDPPPAPAPQPALTTPKPRTAPRASVAVTPEPEIASSAPARVRLDPPPAPAAAPPRQAAPSPPPPKLRTPPRAPVAVTAEPEIASSAVQTKALVASSEAQTEPLAVPVAIEGPATAAPPTRCSMGVQTDAKRHAATGTEAHIATYKTQGTSCQDSVAVQTDAAPAPPASRSVGTQAPPRPPEVAVQTDAEPTLASVWTATEPSIADVGVQADIEVYVRTGGTQTEVAWRWNQGVQSDDPVAVGTSTDAIPVRSVATVSDPVARVLAAVQTEPRWSAGEAGTQADIEPDVRERAVQTAAPRFGSSGVQTEGPRPGLAAAAQTSFSSLRGEPEVAENEPEPEPSPKSVDVFAALDEPDHEPEHSPTSVLAALDLETMVPRPRRRRRRPKRRPGQELASEPELPGPPRTVRRPRAPQPKAAIEAWSVPQTPSKQARSRSPGPRKAWYTINPEPSVDPDREELPSPPPTVPRVRRRRPKRRTSPGPGAEPASDPEAKPEPPELQPAPPRSYDPKRAWQYGMSASTKIRASMRLQPPGPRPPFSPGPFSCRCVIEGPEVRWPEKPCGAHPRPFDALFLSALDRHTRTHLRVLEGPVPCWACEGSPPRTRAHRRAHAEEYFRQMRVVTLFRQEFAKLIPTVQQIQQLEGRSLLLP
eukprot:tig00000586_g2253.t1